jgi:hypothetical protein
VLVQVRISNSKANIKHAQCPRLWSNMHFILLILAFAALTLLVPAQTR